MNQQERDEMRKNHRRDGVLGCWTCQDYAWNDEYPCDVIRVLDAWADTTEYPPEGQNVECGADLRSLGASVTLTVEDAKSVIDYVRTAIDFDQRTAAWALDEVEGILNNWGHLHGMDLYLEADELVEPACDHVTGGVPDEEGKAMVFRYCPKCGEKL